MLLLEHEGKHLLRQYGIATPSGMVVADGQHPGPDVPVPCMAKAQVLTGGRGKAGGIRKVERREEVAGVLRALLQTTIKGEQVKSVLIEESVEFERERYLGIIADGAEIMLVLGAKGGMDVEHAAQTNSNEFRTVRIDPNYGLSEFQVRIALEQLRIDPRWWSSYTDVAVRLAKLFFDCDATMAEINPLVERPDGSVLALDARVVVDDGALFRQPQLEAIAAKRLSEDKLQDRMRELGVQFVAVGGSVGLLSSGAGVGVTIMDWVAREGLTLAAFVDIDYAIMSGRAEEAMRLVLQVFDEDPFVKSIIVNFTVCGLRLDSVADSLVGALRGRHSHKPLTLHFAGNRSVQARRNLEGAGYKTVETLGEAVRQAVREAGKVAQ